MINNIAHRTSTMSMSEPSTCSIMSLTPISIVRNSRIIRESILAKILTKPSTRIKKDSRKIVKSLQYTNLRESTDSRQNLFRESKWILALCHKLLPLFSGFAILRGVRVIALYCSPYFILCRLAELFIAPLVTLCSDISYCSAPTLFKDAIKNKSYLMTPVNFKQRSLQSGRTREGASV